MNIVSRAYVAMWAVLLLLTLLLVGCDEARPKQHHLLISDVSRSGISQSSRLDEVARDEAQRLVQALEPGDMLTVYAFSASLTSACEPITADFAEQGNSEEQDRLKAQLVAAMPEAYASYVECVRDDSVGGSSRPGSPIFGALVEATARSQAQRPLTSTTLVTEGCSFGEGVRTCSRAMTEPGFAEKLIKKMPASLKPDLRSRLTVRGLGQGTGMSSEAISVLRQIFMAYGAATNSTVEFE